MEQCNNDRPCVISSGNFFPQNSKSKQQQQQQHSQHQQQQQHQHQQHQQQHQQHQQHSQAISKHLTQKDDPHLHSPHQDQSSLGEIEVILVQQHKQDALSVIIHPQESMQQINMCLGSQNPGSVDSMMSSDFQTLSPMHDRDSPVSLSTNTSYATLTPLQPLPPISTMSDKFAYSIGGNICEAFPGIGSGAVGVNIEINSCYNLEKLGVIHSPVHLGSVQELSPDVQDVLQQEKHQHHQHHQHVVLKDSGKLPDHLTTTSSTTNTTTNTNHHHHNNNNNNNSNNSNNNNIGAASASSSCSSDKELDDGKGECILVSRASPLPSSLDDRFLGGGSGGGGGGGGKSSEHGRHPKDDSDQYTVGTVQYLDQHSDVVLHSGTNGSGPGGGGSGGGGGGSGLGSVLAGGGKDHHQHHHHQAVFLNKSFSSKTNNISDLNLCKEIVIDDVYDESELDHVKLEEKKLEESCNQQLANGIGGGGSSSSGGKSSSCVSLGGDVGCINGDIEEINTKELAHRISSELKRYSIPQAIFAQRVLCRSQGTLSDLLRNPKPWSKLKSGRETFRRMYKWIQEPEYQRMSALRLAATQSAKPVNSKKPEEPEPHVMMGHTKKPRLVFTDLQRRTLQAIFKETKRPSKEMQVTIARQLGLEPTTVGNFFMNARRRSMDKWKDESSKGRGGSDNVILEHLKDDSSDENLGYDSAFVSGDGPLEHNYQQHVLN
ncbi:homeobox protein onecut isoform X1 [Anopheles ziemanni]|uniref:homeobox protein onecut isoform X1 n=1 Tax=Anopheles coustani TaxID=139045 RepID=UPI0026584A12|nr:homeobox protein onecut isoform X1 [Anopheles coustani]XP_058175808.1 homeobox protein onecut isoform X1 [Anopheles ziemanni]